MNFLHDKHSRYYCIFIVTLVLLLFLMGIAVIDTQTAATKEMFLTHNNAIATSLLEEGISKEVIATALMNTEAGTTGNKFLAEIGLSNSTDIENLPYVSAVKNTILTSLFVMLFLWTLLLFLGTMLFLYRRERLYRESENIIKDYIDGNYTVHLPQSNEGTIYQLLSSVDQLATMLQAKNDTEQKTKEFLKNTISDISHQLKTPLASLKLYNTLLIEEELDDEDRIEFLKTNEMSINKLHNLIDSLVNISRLEASMINIKIENKSIKQTLIKAINSTVPKANQKNININIEDFEDIEIPHDTKWTEESIFNVLENAVKYSSENKDINVQVSETINFIRIDIKDNGIGIDKSEYNNIFKRFYRSEKVDDIEGSGIGLYLSRKILEKQGGNIIVSSQKEQGSKFSLFLTKV